MLVAEQLLEKLDTKAERKPTTTDSKLGQQTTEEEFEQPFNIEEEWTDEQVTASRLRYH